MPWSITTLLSQSMIQGILFLSLLVVYFLLAAGFFVVVSLIAHRGPVEALRVLREVLPQEPTTVPGILSLGGVVIFGCILLVPHFMSEAGRWACRLLQMEPISESSPIQSILVLILLGFLGNLAVIAHTTRRPGDTSSQTK
jgi:uncharacterized protein YacL